MGLAALGCDHYNRGSLCILDCGQMLYEFQAVHDRHIDVAKDQIHFFASQDTESFLSVAGLVDLLDGEVRLP